MSEKVVNLNDNNKTLKETIEKLTCVKHLISEQQLSPLLNIGPYKFNLENREMTHVLPPQKEIILTTYFSSFPDPQRGNFIEKNDFEYIKPLYQSALSLGIGCLIFYDNLSSAFVEKYTTDNIKFVKTSLGNLSLNDERFLIYYGYLLKHSKQIKRVLMVDVSDVFITKNPFDLIRQYPDKLFLGRSNLDLIKHSYVNYLRVEEFKEDVELKIQDEYFSMRLFNAGTVGGDLHVILYLLRQMIYFFKRCDTDRNHNMTILNYCVFLYFIEYPALKKVGFLQFRRLFLKFASILQDKTKIDFLPPSYQCDNNNYQNGIIFSGFPFTSAFKKHEMDSEAYLIHK